MSINGKVAEDAGGQGKKMLLVHDRISLCIQAHPCIVQKCGCLCASATGRTE